jgi:hypothetical protein
MRKMSYIKNESKKHQSQILNQLKAFYRNQRG